jgi:hypothetical protein
MTAHYPALSQTYWVLGESRCQRPFTIKAAATGEGLTQVMQQCGCTMLAGSRCLRLKDRLDLRTVGHYHPQGAFTQQEAR